MNITSIFKLSS